MSDAAGVYFPVSVVDATGRRIRPNNIVSFVDDDVVRQAIVTGWHVEGVVLLTVENDPVEPHEVALRHPSDVRRIDVDVDDDMLPPEFFVEVDGPSTVVVQCIGTRDLVGVGGSGVRLPQLSDFVTRDVSGTQTRPAVRLWSKQVLDLLESMNDEDRGAIVRAELRAPILERALQESVLPRRVRRLVLVATDQGDESVMDTVHVAQILRHWLDAHGHVVGVGQPDVTRRWIDEVLVVTITSLPHVIEAVTHRLRAGMAEWAHDCERVVVVHGGGTPAMNVGVLLAAAMHPGVVVRHVQVPEPDPVTRRIQPLIEMDLDDMPEVGRALGRDGG